MARPLESTLGGYVLVGGLQGRYGDTQHHGFSVGLDTVEGVGRNPQDIMWLEHYRLLPHARPRSTFEDEVNLRRHVMVMQVDRLVLCQA